MYIIGHFTRISR